MSHSTYSPRRQSRSLAVPLLAMAVLVLGIACVVLAVLLMRKPVPTAAEVRAPAPAGTEPASDPQDAWTHKELVEHLNKNGARVRVSAAKAPVAQNGELVSGVVEAHGPGDVDFDDFFKGKVKECTPVIIIRVNDNHSAICIFPPGSIERLVEITELAPVGRRVQIRGKCESRGLFLSTFTECELLK